MEKKNDLIDNIYKYFFIVGPNIPKGKIIENTKEQISEAKLKIKSSYSIEGNSNEYETLYNDILFDKFVQFNIFPSYSNFINIIDFSQDLDQIKVKKGIFEGYYKVENHKPFPKFHSFQHKNWSENNYFEWFFNVLIYYERTPSNIESIDLYVANAIILITKEAYLSLSKYILECIYDKFTNDQNIPIELFIINILNYVTNKYDVIKVLNLTYEISHNIFLPVCDLEFTILYKFFTNKDIFIFAEQFFKRESIIIASNQYELLFPIYYCLICLFHPLGNTDNTYCFKLLCPQTLIGYLLSSFPTMLFIYCDNIENDKMKQICKCKGHKIVYSFIQKENDEYNVTKKIYNINDDEEVFEINFNEDKNLLLKFTYFKINETLSTNIQLINEFIQKRRQEILNEVSGFYDTGDSYEKFRNYYFGIFIKLFLSIIQEIVFEIDDDKIKINSMNNAENNEIDTNIKNKEIINYLNDIKTCPSFEIIYKNDESNLRLDNKNLKVQNLLDLFMTISKIDNSVLFYDLTFEMAKNKKIIQIELLYKINLGKELFYLNKYQRYLLRNDDAEIHINKDEKGLIKISYFKIQLYFDAFIDSKIIVEEQLKNVNLIMMEFDNFYNLYIKNYIPIKSKREIALCTISLVLIIILKYHINDYSFTNQQKLVLFTQILNLMVQTNGFYNKFNFLISILYEILITDKVIYEKYRIYFIEYLKDCKIIPTTTIFLEFNTKVNFFDKIKINKEKLIFKISNLQQIDKDKHHFELEKDSYSDYYCRDKGCQYPLFFSYIDIIGEQKNEILKNPDKILRNIFNEINKRRTFDIENINNFYNNWFDDLAQVSFYSKLYFNLELFTEIN